jgi:hypothetical protein
MSRKLLVTVSRGFITNSSSVIHWFDQNRMLSNPKVRTFLSRYGFDDGSLPNMVGADLYSRAGCSSIATDNKTKDVLINEVECIQGIDELKDESIGIIIYGDEYTSFSSELSLILEEEGLLLGTVGYL